MFFFYRFVRPWRAAPPRMDAASHPYPVTLKLQNCFFNSLGVQHTGYKYYFLSCINFSEISEKYSGHGGHLLIFFSSNYDLVTLISTKPLFRFTLCSTYWMQVLIRRLHQSFRKFGKISGSWRPSLNFFRQIRTLLP